MGALALACTSLALRSSRAFQAPLRDWPLVWPSLGRAHGVSTALVSFTCCLSQAPSVSQQFLTAFLVSHGTPDPSGKIRNLTPAHYSLLQLFPGCYFSHDCRCSPGVSLLSSLSLWSVLNATARDLVQMHIRLFSPLFQILRAFPASSVKVRVPECGPSGLQSDLSLNLCPLPLLGSPGLTAQPRGLLVFPCWARSCLRSFALGGLSAWTALPPITFMTHFALPLDLCLNVIFPIFNMEISTHEYFEFPFLFYLSP